MAPISAARCEIDLSAGGRIWPRSAGDGSKRTFMFGTGARLCAGDREAEPADEILRLTRLLLARDPQCHDALAHVGRRVEREIGDVDSRAAELERELGDNA